MALTRIRQSNITQPLDADLDTLSLSANGNITATGDLTVGGNTAITGSLAVDGNNLTVTTDDSSSILTLERTGAGASQLDISLAAQKATFTSSQDGFKFIQGSSTQYEARFGTHVFNNNSGVATLSLAGDNTATFSNNLTVSGDLLVSGDFTVSGNTTFINSDDLAIEDLNIVLANGAANSAVADGAGITIDGANAQLTYVASGDKFNFNKNVDVIGTIASDGLILSNATYIKQNDASSGQPRMFGMNSGNTTYIGPIDSYAGGAIFYGVSANVTDQRFYTGADERIRIASVGDVQFYENNGGTPKVGMHWDYADGRLGINTTAPNAPLTIGDTGDAAGTLATFRADGVTNFFKLGDNGSKRFTIQGGSSTSSFSIQRNTTEDFVIDSVGNVGIGAAPQAHYTGYTALDIGASGSIFSNRTTGDTNVTMLTNNAYLNSDASAWTYMHNDEATRYAQASGKHLFYNAVASTGAITWKEALVIDASNRLGANVSNPASAIHTHTTGTAEYSSTAEKTTNMSGIKVTASPNESVMTGIWFGTGGDESGTHWSGISGSRVDHLTTWGTRLSFYTHDDSTTNVAEAYERLTIDPDGNVGIGSTTPTHKLEILKSDSTLYDRSDIPTDGSGATMRILNSDTANGPSYAGIHFEAYGASSNGGKGFIGVVNDENWVAGGWSGTHHHLAFGTRSSSFGPVRESMILTSDGNLGIGEDWGDLSTKRPMHTLDVDGAIATRQVRHSIRPTLNLDFANSKQLDPSVTFNRNSPASYYDSKGIIRFANENKPRFDHNPDTGESKGLLIEEERTNVINHIGWFNNTEFDSIIERYAGVSPDGKFNAYRFKINSGRTAAQIRKLYYFGTPLDTNHAFSCYFKNIDATTARLNWGDNGQTGSVTATLTFATEDLVIEGTSGWNAVGRLEKLPNGWYRVELAFYLPAGASATTVPHIGITGSAGQSALVYGFQIESDVNKFATSLIPRDERFNGRQSLATYYDENGILRTAPESAARYGYGYDGRKWVETGLIIEDASTNYSPGDSEGPHDVPFQFLDRVTVDYANREVVSPTGDYLATKVTASDNNTRADYYNASYSFDQPNTLSMYVYPGTNTRFSMGFGDAGELAHTTFDFTNLTSDRKDRSNIEKIGTSGWYRVTYTFTPTDQPGGPFNYSLYFNTGTMWLWGVQMERNARTASSYIPHTGVTTTRAADSFVSSTHTRAVDDAKIKNIQNSNWSSEEEGTFYVEHQVPYDIEDLSLNTRVIERHNGNGSNVTSIIHNGGTDQLNAGMYNNDAWQALIGVTSPYGVVDKNTIRKTAFAYAENDFAMSTQGSPIATDTSGSLTYGNTTLQIGNNSALTGALSGNIKAIRFYPERLSNAEIQALTEND